MGGQHLRGGVGGGSTSERRGGWGVNIWKEGWVGGFTDARRGGLGFLCINAKQQIILLIMLIIFIVACYAKLLIIMQTCTYVDSRHVLY